MMKDGVTMIDTGAAPGKILSERYHFRVSDVEKYVS